MALIGRFELVEGATYGCVGSFVEKSTDLCRQGCILSLPNSHPLDGGLWVASSAWRTLVSVLVALGVPLAVAAWWRDLVAGHPVVALLLASGWLLFLGAWTVVRRATAEPADRRLKQAGNALDRAVGRWVSGYGRRYRHWVLDSRRYIDVKGLATAGDHTPQLDEVYVDVALTRRAPHQVSGDPLSDVPEDATERYSIGKFLDRDEPVVLAIVGPPGCGKSTLLVHVARRSARTSRRNGRNIPILLALRDPAAMVAANPEVTLPEVLRLTVGARSVSEPAGWWERQLQRGRCVVLLDGLDEVAREQDQQAIADWVERQIGSYPCNHFVITSRPRGYRNAVISAANLLTIMPFTREQVRQFLHSWYLATERRATGAEGKEEMRAVRLRAAESACDLLGRLQAAPAIHDLTVNPLLLTMIANVHRYRGALPDSRADLYGEICQVMLSRRIQVKNLSEQMPWPAKENLLTRLAFEMMRRQVRDLPAGQVVEILRPGLRRMPQAVSGQDFLDDVSFNGLLVERENGQYAFAHLTFQEYLAAQHIRENALVKTLISVVDEEWWRETTLLYAVRADIDPVVNACLDQASIPATTLAFECADTGHELAPELRQRLDEIRAVAFQPGCDPARRRVIATVMAARLARHSVIASTGARVCTRPVPVGLYWLFLQDSQAPAPDGPCEPELDPEQTATGVWGSEALAFLSWLNVITADSMQGPFRLPTLDELGEQVVADALHLQDLSSVTSLWTHPAHSAAAPGIWLVPRQVHPHVVTGTLIRRAVTADTTRTELLLQILIAVGLALNHALALDVDPTLTGHRIPVRDSQSNSNLIHDRARERDLVLARMLAIARRLDQTLPCDLAIDFCLEHPLGLDRTLDIARALACSLDHSLARSLDLDRTLARDLSHASDPPLDLGLDLDLDRVLRFALTWIVGEPLGLALRQAIGSRPDATGEQFAAALMSAAGISDSARVEVPLDGSLMEKVRNACAAGVVRKHTDSSWNPATVAERLAHAAEPLLGQHRLPATSAAAGIRAAALALAGSTAEDEKNALDTLQILAAAVTLLQQRAAGNVIIGESIVLARA